MKNTVKSLTSTVEEQARDYVLLADEMEQLSMQSTPPGPLVWVGDIISEFHEIEQGFDCYYWPKLWFSQFKDEIVYEARETEYNKFFLCSL